MYSLFWILVTTSSKLLVLFFLDKPNWACKSSSVAVSISAVSAKLLSKNSSNALAKFSNSGGFSSEFSSAGLIAKLLIEFPSSCSGMNSTPSVFPFLGLGKIGLS